MAHLLGAHVSIAGGLHRAFDRALEATCDAMQVFNKANHQWAARDLEPGELELWFEAMTETGVLVACSHNSYLINLATPDAQLREKSCRSFRDEVERCHVLGIPNLVFHPGAHLGSGVDAGVARIAEACNRVFDELPGSEVVLCLETTAGTGTHLGARFEELAAIIDRVDNRAMMGVCLDTCHVFAAGYDLAGAEGYAGMMDRLAETVGLERLKVLHVNDSKTPLGSRRDRHEHIGAGCIGLRGFRNVLADPRLRGLPMILETPKGPDLAEDVMNLGTLRRLAGERTAAVRGPQPAACSRSW